jgi:hypothetical protein
MAAPVKCFVTFRLKPGVTMEDYERWFRTENLAAVGTMTAIRNYRVWRRESVYEGEPAWDVIEEMEVLDRDACEREFSGLPEMLAMQETWREMVADQVVVFTEEIAQG